ncbi:MAG TPA: PKD domain-containing protein [Thermoplasmata archaeon]|nr:PKD domain-containing protein [Thermoplasmata archaeon]
MASPALRLSLLVIGAGFVSLLCAASATAQPITSHPAAGVNCSNGLRLDLSGTTGPAPYTVDFVLTVYWGTPTSVSWSFGDGTYSNGSGTGSLTLGHTFETVGNFQSTVTVQSGTRSGACSVAIQTTPAQLVVTASGSPTEGVAPLTVELTGTITGGSGTFTQIGWSFGDNHYASGESLAYTYSIPGIYHAVFTVVDTYHDVSNATVTIQVLAASAGPSNGSLSLGTITIFTLLGTMVAASAGAALYVRGRAPKFSSDDDPDAELDVAELYEPAPRGGPVRRSVAPGLRPAPPTELVTSEPSRYPAEMYRSKFLDLSDREFDVLAGTAGELESSTSIVPMPADRILSAPPREVRVKLSHRVLLHLYAQPRLGTEEVATQAFTQAGMVETLGVQQSLLSNVLRRLTYSHLIVLDVRHVQGSTRRLNVYRLTPKGETLAEKIRKVDADRAAAADVPSSEDGDGSDPDPE